MAKRRAGRVSDDSLVLLATDAMRARRHPWTIAGLWVWQTTLAVAVGWPAASLVRASFGAASPGDASLWRSGAQGLLDFLWRSARGLAPLATTAEIVLLVGSIAGLLPTGTAMIAMAYARRDRHHAGLVRSASGAITTMPALLLLWAFATAAQAAFLGLGALLIEGADVWLRTDLGVARTQRIDAAIGVALVVAASGLGVAHDLGRAAVVRFKAGAIRALVIGARTLGRAPLPVWWSWAWRALVSIVPVLAAAAVSTRIGGRGGWPLVLLAFLHQCVVLARVALRASWLAHALRAVDRTS